MIPGTLECLGKNTQLLYTGYIMASHYTQRASEYVCVDKTLAVIEGFSLNADGHKEGGAQLYFTEIESPLRKGESEFEDSRPFQENYEMVCAVCLVTPA